MGAWFLDSELSTCSTYHNYDDIKNFKKENRAILKVKNYGNKLEVESIETN